MTRLFGAAIGWFFVVFCVTAADPLARWHLRNPLVTANQLKGVTFGNGRYVAVGDQGTVIVSEDLIHWRRADAGVSENLYSVVHGNGRFVAVGQNGRVLTSIDGEQWFSVATQTNILLWDVCFGAGQFVAVGYPTSVWVSTDGTNWWKTFEPGTNAPASRSLRAVTYGAGRFVAVGFAQPMTSLDATNWVLSTNLFRADDITYGNGRFFCFGSSESHEGRPRISPDGVTWQRKEPSFPYQLPGVSFGNDFFLAVPPSGGVFTTIDGGNLLFRTNAVRGVLCFDGSRFVVVSSSSVWQSQDGVRWQQMVQSVGQFFPVFSAQATDGHTTLAFASDYVCTTNGVTWAEKQWPFASPVYDAIFAQGKFVSVGGSGMIVTSTNAIEWSAAFSGSTEWLRSVCAARGWLYARPDDGRMIVSSNGAAWFPAEFDAVFSDVADNGERLVAVNGTNIITSLTGVVWITNAFVSPRFLQGVAYANGRFVAIGQQGLIATSADGIDWSLISSGTEVHLNAITFGDGMFVIVGNTGAILTSADGTNWMGQVAGTSASLRNVTWNGKTFITSGDNGVILESDPLNATAPFIIRHPPPTVAHRGTELSLDVIASGSSPLGYQWFRNSVAVDAATNTYLYRRMVSPADAGDYFVIVSNFVGSATSLIASVSVLTNVEPPVLKLRRENYTELEIVGTPGAEQIVEFAPTLGDSNAWHTLRTIVSATTTTTIPDVSSTNVSLRFYRGITR